VSTDENLLRYYSARASEYEEIYERPERQRDLVRLRRFLTELTSGEKVLELACGTGYWTRVMARSATVVLAVDASAESVEIARGKEPRDSVTFAVADIEGLEAPRHSFSMAVAGFLWSHIPLQEIDGFLERLAARLDAGTRAVFFDNRYVEGSSSLISHRDRYGNTYQERTIASGEKFMIVKNFPTTAQLFETARRVGTDVRVEEMEYFWLLQFTTPDSPRLRSA
jgi:demethylmenaquinone methyltransferase/2-methoxy-6-polyprenyl-1,4-benzoquinol methylase